MQAVFESLSAVLSILASFQKKKWLMMFYYVINNIVSIVVYLLCGRIAALWIAVVALLRTIVIMFFSLKGIKPNVYVLITFELAYTLATILTWQDAFDLMPLIASLVAGYGSWQDGDFVLRISYVINKALFMVYKFIIGTYIMAGVEVLLLVCNIVGLIYYSILKKEKPIMESLMFWKKKKVAVETVNNNEIDKENSD